MIIPLLLPFICWGIDKEKKPFENSAAAKTGHISNCYKCYNAINTIKSIFDHFFKVWFKLPIFSHLGSQFLFRFILHFFDSDIIFSNSSPFSWYWQKRAGLWVVISKGGLTPIWSKIIKSRCWGHFWPTESKYVGIFEKFWVTRILKVAFRGNMKRWFRTNIIQNRWKSLIRTIWHTEWKSVLHFTCYFAPSPFLHRIRKLFCISIRLIHIYLWTYLYHIMHQSNHLHKYMWMIPRCPRKYLH